MGRWLSLETFHFLAGRLLEGLRFPVFFVFKRIHRDGDHTPCIRDLRTGLTCTRVLVVLSVLASFFSRSVFAGGGAIGTLGLVA